MATEDLKTGYEKYQALIAEDSWEKTSLTDKQEDGFTLTTTTKANPEFGNGSTYIRNEFVFKNCKVDDVVAAFATVHADDPYLRKEPVKVEEKENSTVYYAIYKIPIPFMKDRENLTEISVEKMENGTFVLAKTVEHPEYPESKDFVRMAFWGGQFHSQEGDDVKLVTIECVDGKHMLLNGFAAGDTLKDCKWYYAKIGA